MAKDVCKVRAPASSANLGPGFDVMAAALSLWLELEVVRSGSFSVDTGSSDLPQDGSNLCVASFAKFLAADEYRFTINSDIPIASGLGSSGAAIVAGLVAANEFGKLGLGQDELLQHATELEGHPDNVAASLYGGFVICSKQEDSVVVDRIEPPPRLEAVAVIPHEPLSTAEARAAIPALVDINDVVFNTSHAALITLGLASGDIDLLSRGLADRVHQPARRHLYPRSMELVERAAGLGALGATISGAGPTVLFWSLEGKTDALAQRLTAEVDGWAAVKPLHFEASGAQSE